MHLLPQKRHNRWYERLAFNMLFQWLMLELLVIILPAMWMWGAASILSPSQTQHTSLVANTGVVMAILFCLHKLMNYPGDKSSSFIF